MDVKSDQISNVLTTTPSCLHNVSGTIKYFLGLQVTMTVLPDWMLVFHRVTGSAFPLYNIMEKPVIAVGKQMEWSFSLKVFWNKRN